jgi:hypothetical protein
MSFPTAANRALVIRPEVNRLAVLAHADQSCVQRLAGHLEQAGERVADALPLAVDHGDDDLAHVVHRAGAALRGEVRPCRAAGMRTGWASSRRVQRCADFRSQAGRVEDWRGVPKVWPSVLSEKYV